MIHPKHEAQSMLNDPELAYLVETVKELDQNALVFAAGVCRGGDVAAMAAARPDLRFFVVDSFEGLAEPRPEDESADTAKAGECDPGGMAAFDDVTRQARVVATVRGWITPELARFIAPAIMRADMVWLDLDHYTPTNELLFYAVRGTGRIFTHDYGFRRTPGIKRACDAYGEWELAMGSIAEFMQSKH